MKIQLKKMGVAVAFSLGVTLSAQAVTLDLTGKSFITYGDAQTYSLNALAVQYEVEHGGTGNTINPGNPYYITSTPGAIKDLVVLATGAGGTGVTTNVAGMDSAYATPSGVSGSTFFTTDTAVYPLGTPTPSASFTGKQVDTWDTTLSALQGFLGTGGAPVFFFNNNQVNSGASTNQNLGVWGQATITNSSGTVIGTYDLTNRNREFALGTNPNSGGVVNGSVSAYTSAAGYNDPIDGTNANTDYVFSGGKYCLNSLYAPVACDGSQGPIAFGPISNNLGADQAAYAILIPEMNAQLSSLFTGGEDLTGYAMHIDLRMGCDLSNPVTNPDCVGRSLNNGYEQVFMGSTASDYVNAPEPSSIFLIGLGLLGMGWSMHRRRGTGRLTA